jgi:pyruvate,orthophosphate dikinase
VHYDVELDAGALRELVGRYKHVYARAGKALPDDPWQQLEMGIDAVFRC